MRFDAGLRAIGSSGLVGLCNWTINHGIGRILDADDAFIAMLGYDADSFAQAGPFDWRRLTPPDSVAVLDERFAELIEHGAHGPRMQELVARFDERVPVLVASAMADAATGLATSLCVDLSEPLRAGVDAERASQAKSRFLAVMTHELRTPLTTILGQAELVDEGTYGAVTDNQHAALRRLRRAANQLRTLVDQVLTFSRLETGMVQYDLQDVQLAGALSHVVPDVRALAEAKGADFRLQLPDDDVRVRADPEKLHDVLRALLSNAVKFTPPGGRVTLDTAQRAAASDFVFIRVSDTGNGIARERQAAIFEPFAQMDEGRSRTATGMGLGLTISRDLAAGMGGYVRVRSGGAAGTPGAGSTFTLALLRGVGR